MLNITQDFPLLSRLQEGGRRFVYFDNAATSQKPQCVLDAMSEWYVMRNANPHRGVYNFGKMATDTYEDSRKVVASHINAEPDEIIFCRNTTEAINMAARAFFTPRLHAGDEIALPISEHHSDLLPWQQLAQEKGIALNYLLPDRFGRLSDEEIEKKITTKTRLVVCAQVSNVLGTVFPLQKLVQQAKAVGAYTLFDCAQGLLHCGIDAKEIGADFLAFSSHKAFGPNGIGVLYGRRELLREMDPFLRGGEMVTAVSERNAIFEKPPLRFEAGTQDGAGAYGFATALNYIETLGRDQIREHEEALTVRLMEGLASQSNLKIYGNPEYAPDRCGIVAFNMGGQSPLSVAFYLDQVGIAIRAGTHCAMPLLTFLGTGATCRVSFAPYNTLDEVDYFLEALAEVPRTIASTALKGR